MLRRFLGIASALLFRAIDSAAWGLLASWAMIETLETLDSSHGGYISDQLNFC